MLLCVFNKMLTWSGVQVFLLSTVMSADWPENTNREGGISTAIASGTFSTTCDGFVSREMIYQVGKCI